MIRAIGSQMALPSKLARPFASVHIPARLVTHLGQCRGGLGAVLLLFPGLTAGLVANRPLGRGPRRIVRLLAVRQLSQALVTGTQSSAAVLILGAEVDVTHAASMVTLALWSRRWRRAALVDAVIASLFAAVGVATARHRGRPRQAEARWSAMRDRVSCQLVPRVLLSWADRAAQGGARA